MIQIKQPQTRDDFKAYYDLRYKVLREPWGLAKGTEKDDYEPISQHYMAVDDQTSEIVGCAKLFEKESGVAWISHLAVTEKRQHQGIGQLLVAHIENIAREQQFKKIGCLARLNTTRFFEKEGYRISGLPAHYIGTTQVVWMEKEL